MYVYAFSGPYKGMKRGLYLRYFSMSSLSVFGISKVQISKVSHVNQLYHRQFFHRKLLCPQKLQGLLWTKNLDGFHQNRFALPKTAFPSFSDVSIWIALAFSSVISPKNRGVLNNSSKLQRSSFEFDAIFKGLIRVSEFRQKIFKIVHCYDLTNFFTSRKCSFDGKYKNYFNTNVISRIFLRRFESYYLFQKYM